MPQRIGPDLDLELLLTALLQLPQGEIDLLGQPPAQEPVMLLQTAATVAANLFRPTLARLGVLLPEALDTAATDAEAPANFPDTFTLFPRPNDALTQVLT
jgi:hypothetical protein